jgi:hypothetical protein
LNVVRAFGTNQFKNQETFSLNIACLITSFFKGGNILRIKEQQQNSYSSFLCGTNSGFDIELINHIRNNVSIPVIASSGAGKVKHFSEVFE